MEEITNLSDFLTEIADAIREKKDSTDLIEAQDFADEIRSMTSFNPLQYMIDNGPGGQPSAQGLFANSGLTSLDLVLEHVDLSQCVSVYQLFYYCMNLISVPPLKLDSAQNFMECYAGCLSLEEVAPVNTDKATCIDGMFKYCYRLKTIDLSYVSNNFQFGASWQPTWYGIVSSCYSLIKIILRNMDEILDYRVIFGESYSNVATSNWLHHFTGTQDDKYNPEGLQDGYVYVPDDKVEALRAAEGWSTIADRIRGLSELDE